MDVIFKGGVLKEIVGIERLGKGEGARRRAPCAGGRSHIF